MHPIRAPPVRKNQRGALIAPRFPVRAWRNWQTRQIWVLVGCPGEGQAAGAPGPSLLGTGEVGSPITAGCLMSRFWDVDTITPP
jgi:hypothetical protein